MTVELRCLGGVSHPLQLTTGLVINSSVTTSPTLAGEHMLLIPKVSILSEQVIIHGYIYISAMDECFLSFKFNCGGKKEKLS